MLAQKPLGSYCGGGGREKAIVKGSQADGLQRIQSWK